jgi:predicted phosphate transport protein (TIGR00153 family)
MRNILNLFGKSPFAPLQNHMEKVASCVRLLPEIFQALKDNQREKVEELAQLISEREHAADLTKNDIRNHLPKTLFLAMDRSSLLEILAIQDSIADKAEDIAVLLTLKALPIIEEFWDDFQAFLRKNIETFEDAFSVIRELHELLESSFGGIEAEKVSQIVDRVGLQEHEADIIQRKLLKDLFSVEEKLTLSTFHLWQRVFESVGALSNLSEKLANRIRMTLELQ